MKSILLISGGIDSPVAGYLMKRKGLEIIALHFSTEPLTNNEPEIKSEKACKVLGIKKMLVANVSKQFSEIVKKCEHKYYYILTKRLMWKIAEKIAEKENCKYLITGENLGQVSSQTLSNLCVIDSAVKIQVLRPILANDKNETIKLANKIGTYEISKGPEFCCVLGPKSPATHSKREAIESEEAKLDTESMLKEAKATIRVKEL